MPKNVVWNESLLLAGNRIMFIRDTHTFSKIVRRLLKHTTFSLSPGSVGCLSCLLQKRVCNYWDGWVWGLFSNVYHHHCKCRRRSSSSSFDSGRFPPPPRARIFQASLTVFSPSGIKARQDKCRIATVTHVIIIIIIISKPEYYHELKAPGILFRQRV